MTSTRTEYGGQKSFEVDMSRIVAIVNPHSGKNKRNPQIIERFRQILGTQGVLFSPSSIEEMNLYLLRALRQTNVEILCINGGDGTIHKVITILFQILGDNPWPKIVILKGGTMNNIARNIGIPLFKNAHTLLQEIVEYDSYTTIKKHPLIVDETYAGFIYGTSGISAYLEEYYDGGNPSVWKAAMIAIRSMLSAVINGEYVNKIFASRPIRLQVDGQKGKENHSTNMGISTVSDLGFYLRPFYATLERPDIAHVITMNCSPLYLLFALPNMWMARPTNKSYIEDMSGQEIDLHFEGEQSFTLDGDLYPIKGEQRIRVGRSIEFIIGKK